MTLRLGGNLTIGTLSGGPSALNFSDLHDVSIVNPLTGQYPRYNGTISEWENAYINSDVFGYMSTSTSGINGITFSANTGTLQFTIGLSGSGVSPGTYNTVAVDSYGRVTTGSNAMYLLNNQTISISGDATGSGSVSIPLTLTNTGVAAGVYTQVNVDTKGRVIGGANPSTLVGMGITDAQPLSLELTGIASQTGVGLLARTGTGAYSERTITGTVNRIVVSDGDGQLDNPTIDLDTIGTSGTYNSVTTDAYGRVIAGTSQPYITGNQTVTLSGDATGSGTTAISVTLPNIATSGTYRSVNVNSKGQVIAGTNPTTLSGYGITDALPLSGGMMSGNIVIPSGVSITITDSPINGTDAANKNYVDSAVAGLTWKASVLVGAFTNITLSGTQTIDGVAVNAGDRVLVAGQTTASQNGIYVVAVGSWTRSTDANTGAELVGAAVFVSQGSVYADSAWTCTNTVIVLGTTAITFTQFNGASGITAGVGLLKTGNVLSVNMGAGIAQLPTYDVGVDLYTGGGLLLTTDGSTPSTSASAQLSLTPTGVVAGSYTKVSVDQYGRVLSSGSISSSDVTTALGYTPYDALNPAAYISGNQTITISGDISGSGTTSISATLPNIVTAGVYNSVTVNAKGQVTAGTNPTTLSGYGIVDAQPLSGELTSLSTQTGVGVVTRTGSSTYTERSIAGASGRITITNANGATGNPTVDLTPLGIAGTYNNVTVDNYGRVSTATTVPYITGNENISISGDASGSGATTITLSLALSGVAAGTYGSAASTTATYPIITVDAKGRITSATTSTFTPSYPVTSVSGKTGAVTLTSSDVGLSNVTNALQVYNAGGATSYAADVYANLPMPGTNGRFFFATDTNATYFDNGSTWQLAQAPISGDISISGGTATLASVNSNVGTFNNVTVNNKGLVTSAANVGYLTSNQTITISGDATGTGTTAIGLTLANSGVTAGTYGNATHAPIVTVDNKGRVTTVTTTTITPAFSSITGTPTTLGGYGITDAQPLNATLTSVAALSTSTTGVIKLTSGVASLDTTPYLTSNQTITISGDATGTGTTAIGLTLANSGVTAGTYNSSSTQHSPLSIDAKGRVTSVGTAVTITPAFSSITGTPTTLGGYGITDALSSSGGTVTGNITMSGATVTGIPTPTNASDVASKSYVDSIANNTTWKTAVRAATTSNITLSGTQSIDGVSVIVGDRVLVKAQTTQSDNGIYVVASGAWTRASDSSTGAQIVSEAVFVTSGTANADTQWVNTNTSITLGTTSITYIQFGAGSAYSAGTGIQLTGSVFSNTGVLSLTGTSNQISVSSSTGAVTLSLPTTISGLTSVSSTGFTGALTGAASSNVLKAGDTMTGTLNIYKNVASQIFSFKGLVDGGNYGEFLIPAGGTLAYLGSSTAIGGGGTGSDFVIQAPSGKIFLLSTAGIVTPNDVKITSSTASSTTATGALVVSGGVGIAGALNGSTAGFSGTVTAPTFSGALSGNATTATTATSTNNITGGAAGAILYQSATNTTAFTGVGTANQILISNGSSAPTWSSTSPVASSLNVLKAGDTMTGSLVFSGTGLKISGDFSNSTQTSRMYFQSSTTNGSTVIPIRPNGTSQTSGLSFKTGSAIGNDSTLEIGTNGSNNYIQSGSDGTGTYLPLWLSGNSTNTITLNIDGSITANGALTCNAGLSGNLTGTSTGIAGGTAGKVLYQTGAGATGFTAAGTAGQVLVSGGTGAPTWTSSPAITSSLNVAKAGDTMTGSLTFSGAVGLRGDYSNATLTSRSFIQTSTSNSDTLIPIIPNGSGINTGFTFKTSSALSNGSSFDIGCSGASAYNYIFSNFDGSGSRQPIRISANATNSMVFNIDGTITANTVFNAASGTASSSTATGALVVTGGVGISGSLFGVGATFSGTVNAATFNATSTKRVKANIVKLSDVQLSKFDQLQPREYDRTDYVAHEFGFIAEEVNELYPEIVGKDENGLATGVDYGKLTAILTAKVQEQQATIDKLQEQINFIVGALNGK